MVCGFVKGPVSMTNKPAPEIGKRSWTRPELVRLGTIRDIAQGPAPLNQANNNKRS